MFVTSLVTERILFYDFYKRSFRLFAKNEEVFSESESGEKNSNGYVLPVDFAAGASHVASDGNDVLYAAPEIFNPRYQEGSIKRLNWQTGYASLALNGDSFVALSDPPPPAGAAFDPGVMRFDAGSSTLAFSNRGERGGGDGTGKDTLYYWKYKGDTLKRMYAAEAGCVIVDIAMERSATDVLETLVLTRCGPTTPEYGVKKVSVTVADDGFGEPYVFPEEEFAWASAVDGAARSVEWISKEVS